MSKVYCSINKNQNAQNTLLIVETQPLPSDIVRKLYPIHLQLDGMLCLLQIQIIWCQTLWGNEYRAFFLVIVNIALWIQICIMVVPINHCQSIITRTHCSFYSNNLCMFKNIIARLVTMRNKQFYRVCICKMILRQIQLTHLETELAIFSIDKCDFIITIFFNF